jgi:hypothetical protein
MNEEDRPLDIFEQTTRRSMQECFARVDAEQRECAQQEHWQRVREQDAARRAAIEQARQG